MKQYPQHIQWLIENFSRQVKTKLSAENIDIEISEAFDVFMEADPSCGKKATDWLVKAYIGEGFLWEDIAAGSTSKACSTLREFAQHRKNLPKEARNLAEYKKLSHVWRAIKPFIEDQNSEELSSRALKRREKEEALGESKILWKDENVIVSIPLSKQSAQWWGKGTRWCTGADDRNMFDSYNSVAPLVVLTFPKGLENDKGARKLQLWASSDSFQFMDEDDSEVLSNSDIVVDNWKIFKPILEWVFPINPSVITYFPQDELTQDMCTRALKHNPEVIWSIPNHFLTYSECMEALKKDWQTAQWIPDEFMDRAMCDEVIKGNPTQLEYIPLAMITEDYIYDYLVIRNDYKKTHTLEHMAIIPQDQTIDRAIVENPKAIFFLPRNMINSERIIRALENHLPFVDLYRQVPELINENIHAKIIEISRGSSAHQIPEEDWTEKLAILVAEQGDYFYCVPEEFRNREFYTRVLESKPKDRTIHTFPEWFWNDIDRYSIDICLQKYPLSLQYIPQSKLSKEDYIVASQVENFFLKDVPLKWKIEIFLGANPENHNWMNLKDIPNCMKTKEICDLVVSRDPYAIMELPARLIDYQMSLSVVERVPSLITHIPRKLHSVELSLAAVKAGYYPLKDIMPKYRTAEVCAFAVKNLASNARLVPRSILTDEFWQQALADSPFVVEYMPKSKVKPYMYHDLYWYNKQSIGLIPPKLLTDEILEDYRMSILQRNSLINTMPEHLKTKEFLFPLFRKESYIKGYFKGEVIELWEKENPTINHIPNTKDRVWKEEDIMGLEQNLQAQLSITSSTSIAQQRGF